MAEESPSSPPSPSAGTEAGMAELAAGPAGDAPQSRRPRRWDPTRSEDWDAAGASQMSLRRIRCDLMAIFSDPSCSDCESVRGTLKKDLNCNWDVLEPFVEGKPGGAVKRFFR